MGLNPYRKKPGRTGWWRTHGFDSVVLGEYLIRKGGESFSPWGKVFRNGKKVSPYGGKVFRNGKKVSPHGGKFFGMGRKFLPMGKKFFGMGRKFLPIGKTFSARGKEVFYTGSQRPGAIQVVPPASNSAYAMLRKRMNRLFCKCLPFPAGDLNFV
jgi:hypothetical protein